MLVIRNNICYIEAEDYLRLPVPDFISVPNHLEEGTFIPFYKPEEIVYFSERNDILNYDAVKQLTDKEITQLIEELENEVRVLINKVLDMELVDREKALVDPSLDSIRDIKESLKSIYSYKANRKKYDLSVEGLNLLKKDQQEQNEQPTSSDLKKSYRKK